MKILYFHQYFKTPDEPGSTRSYWIAKELIKNGHNVTIITANSQSGANRFEKCIDGINVIYLNEPYNQDMSVFQRLRAFLGFVYKSSLEALGKEKFDLVIATSTPLTIGIPALFLKWFKNTPYIFEVRDLWPEVPIQMGAFKNVILIKIIRFFEKTLYINAHHVVALSPGMQDGVTKFINVSKTSMIPNMSKIDEFWARPKNIKLNSKLGLLKDSFKVIHFGALGQANGANTIIESAKLLKDDPSIEFLFVGGGSTEKELVELCRIENLTNVKFLGVFSLNGTSEIVNLSDVSIVSFKDLPILYTNSPNKLFDSLSAGKPIIVNSAGWTKDLVETNSCGYYVNPLNPQDLVDKIKYLQDSPEIVKTMGHNARVLAENVYDKSILAKKFVHVVENLNY